LTQFDGLAKTLPDNVHILTLEPWQEDSYILRLEHILENNEDDSLSQAVSVDLSVLTKTVLGDGLNKNVSGFVQSL
jgi:lysosomal alpha-mannosidase